MSVKKARRAKVLKVPQVESQKGSSVHAVDSPNLSAIERASFLDGLQLSFGNPLHSTAMEEDLNVLEEGQVNIGNGRKDIPKTLKTTTKQRGAAVKRKETENTLKTTTKQRGAAVKRKETERDEENEKEEKKKRSRISNGGKVKARPVKNQQMKKSKKRQSESGSRKSSDAKSQEESDIGITQRRRIMALSSDEEVLDEDVSWNPSPKKAKMHSFLRSRKSSSNRSASRKSSSGSTSADGGKANTDKQKRMRRGHKGGTELEVVLDAFLDFCEQYRESVNSKAVKESIDSFSSNVREQLLEKISSYKELRVLKRTNARVGSLIHKKTQRLLDAKYELMRAERQASLLQKEKAELQLRLTDLKQGQAFLRDIRELNGQYLDFRHKHPRKKETYGASSLQALLLETKHIQTAEHQLRGINNQLEKRKKKGN